MKKLRFAVLGTGFWANYQIPAWMELEGVGKGECQEHRAPFASGSFDHQRLYSAYATGHEMRRMRRTWFDN